MRTLKSLVLAAILSAGLMLAMSAALMDDNVAFALGVAVFVALGGLSAGRRSRK